MKKIFTLLALLLCLQFTTVSAQQNIYVWKDGSLSVMATSEVDSLTFDVGSWLYNIYCSSPVGITTVSAQAIVNVSLGSNLKEISEAPEIGVCFSEDSQQPTVKDHTVKLGSSMNSYSVTMSGCYSGTTYHYRAYVKLLDKVFYSDVQTFTTSGDNNQPSINYTMVNGHKFVDLGLPSGLKWAACNVGANVPEADGDYFAWGEVEPKSYYGWSTYKWSKDGSSSSFTKYTYSSGKTTLDAEDDAATQNWGEGCRMPTKDEFQELLDNCTCTWTTMNGVNGYKFTSKTNGAFVFFPASGYRSDGYLNYHGSFGYYWSSSLDTRDDDGAYYLYFNASNCSCYNDNRYKGHSVRAVCP